MLNFLLNMKTKDFSSEDLKYLPVQVHVQVHLQVTKPTNSGGSRPYYGGRLRPEGGGVHHNHPSGKIF